MISKDLKFVEDLLYYDGPLVSKYQENDNIYIVFALSFEKKYEKFAFINSEKKDVKDFLNGEIDLLKLLKISKSIVIFETVNVYVKETWLNLNEISFEKMESKYLPSEGLYIEEGI